MIEKIILALIGGVIGFASSVGRIWLERRRTGAINSTRIISTFLVSQSKSLKENNTDSSKHIFEEIERCLQYPNSLGSEAKIAVLISKIHVHNNLSERELRKLDRALNALDQRATDRERRK